MSTDMVRYSLAWRNPYTTPAGPRVLKAMLVPRGAPCPPEIKELWVAGGGYCISWELVSQKPIKRWSAEAKARTRRRNLRQRHEDKRAFVQARVRDGQLRAIVNQIVVEQEIEIERARSVFENAHAVMRLFDPMQTVKKFVRRQFRLHARHRIEKTRLIAKTVRFRFIDG